MLHHAPNAWLVLIVHLTLLRLERRLALYRVATLLNLCNNLAILHNMGMRGPMIIGRHIKFNVVSVSRVIGKTMADTPVGDLLLAWRIRELIAARVLEARGEGPFGAAEVRRTPRAAIRVRR